MPPRSRKAEKDNDDVTTTDDTAVREDEAGRNAEISTASPVGRHPRDTQFPSLGDDGDPEVEVAERTVDIDTANGVTTASANHIKDFVVTAADWDGLDDEGKDAVHYRNQRAVRQSMLSQGLRAPLEEDVYFAGEERIAARRYGRDSVRLRYEIAPTPVAAVMTADEPEYELVHMVVSPAGTDDHSLGAKAQDEWENGAEERVRASHAVREGRAPAPTA